MRFRPGTLLLCAALAGCGGTIHTDPNAAAIDAFRLRHLRAPQAVALANGQPEATHEIRSDSNAWQVDARQLTETAVTVLRRGLEERGIQVAAPAPKSLTLRVKVHGAYAQFVPAPTVVANARLILEVDFGDGTSAWVEGTNGSAFGTQRAFEGAIVAALNNLLINPSFNDYMNR